MLHSLCNAMGQTVDKPQGLSGRKWPWEVLREILIIRGKFPDNPEGLPAVSQPLDLELTGPHSNPAMWCENLVSITAESICINGRRSDHC